MARGLKELSPSWHGDRLFPWQREFGASVCYIVATKKQEFELEMRMGSPSPPHSDIFSSCFLLSQGVKSYQKALLSRDLLSRHVRAKLLDEQLL